MNSRNATDTNGHETEDNGVAKPAISLKSMSKSFGDNLVIDGLTLDIPRGEVLVLCGPSGCGKSTLLRCINGLESIDSGEIWVEDIAVHRATAENLKRVRLSTGLVFQNFNLFPHMTALENITIAPIKIKCADKSEAEQHGISLLESVGIPEKASEYPYQLSGGQRQRVAIARALAMQPKVLMFDEPTSALDPEMREEVLEVIRNVHLEHGITMIVVTHEIAFARNVAQRAILMEQGRIIEEGPAAEFFANPITDRAKRFLRAIKND